MRRFRQLDKGLRELEAELRAHRPEPRSSFVSELSAQMRGETRWFRPRMRLVLVVALAGLAFAAMASAGGFSAITSGTSAAVHVLKRATQASSPIVVAASPSNNQYKNHCGGPSTGKCHISIADAKVREGSSGTTPMKFAVTLSAKNDAPVSVNYATSNGTAMGGGGCVDHVDYITQSGTVTFQTGVSSGTITILVCGDKVVEPDETFTVTLSGPSSNADIARATATGTIVNDDK
jgi:hypothetical protein